MSQGKGTRSKEKELGVEEPEIRIEDVFQSI
ncbi:unnamed protein product, partial [Allacma fusca]